MLFVFGLENVFLKCRDDCGRIVLVTQLIEDGVYDVCSFVRRAHHFFEGFNDCILT